MGRRLFRQTDTLGGDDLDEEGFASRRHGCSAVGQDSDRRLVVPVVDDPLQQVGVPAGWHGFREVACHLLDTVGSDVPVDGPAGRLHHVGKVEERQGPGSAQATRVLASLRAAPLKPKTYCFTSSRTFIRE
jgi:hypothetical protein